MVNKSDRIYRRKGGVSGRWELLTGRAKDVGVGGLGDAWVIGTNPEAGGYGIYRYNGHTYRKIPGSAVRIAVGTDGNAWVVNK